MDKFCVLFNFILIITTFGSIMSANSIGFLYDDQRQKLDRNYKGNHSFRYNKNWKHKFAFSFPFPIVNKVFEKLYTPYGLRTLNKEDKDFKPIYGGSHFNRDMAYHQGTVWAFPLGGYYLAYLKVNNDSLDSVNRVKEQLSALEACMREGCIGQIAEIFDGENPTISQGCFAQAWSVSELLRVYSKLEKLK